MSLWGVTQSIFLTLYQVIPVRICAEGSQRYHGSKSSPITIVGIDSIYCIYLWCIVMSKCHIKGLVDIWQWPNLVLVFLTIPSSLSYYFRQPMMDILIDYCSYYPPITLRKVFKRNAVPALTFHKSQAITSLSLTQVIHPKALLCQCLYPQVPPSSTQRSKLPASSPHHEAHCQNQVLEGMPYMKPWGGTTTCMKKFRCAMLDP